MNILQISKEIHETAVEKGFWTADSNSTEKFALIITELCEAIESHRGNRFANVTNFNNAMDAYAENFPIIFEAYIKDSVEDELADAVIRCLDYLYRHKKEFFTIEEVNIEWKQNFAENIYIIIRANIDYDAAYIVSYVQSLSKHLEIDLEWHIKQKMRYNSTRPYKHNKQY